MRDMDYWRRTIAGSTKDLTADIIESAAKICFAADQDGRPVGAWHAVSMVTDTLDRCPCVPCRKNQSRMAT